MKVIASFVKVVVVELSPSETMASLNAINAAHGWSGPWSPQMPDALRAAHVCIHDAIRGNVTIDVFEDGSSAVRIAP